MMALKDKVTFYFMKTTPQPNWTIIGLISVIVAFLFFQPFLGVICISALMAYLLYPIYCRLTKHLPDSVSAIIILIGSSLLIIVPIIIISFIAISQAFSFAHSLENTSLTPGSSLYELSGPIITKINNLLAPLGNDSFISSDSIINFIKGTVPSIINVMGNAVFSFLGNLPKLFTSIIIYCFLFMAFLKYNKSVQRLVKSLSPFDEKLSETYFEKSGLIVSSSLKGQFIISVVTAVSSSLLLGIGLGLMPYFLFFVIIFTLLGMIPLGSGVIVIPIAVIAMITNNFWPGFWVLLIYLAIICNLDSVLRPHLIPKKANMIPALTTLATFCGIYYFGMLGIIYGPLVVILLTTTVDIYTSTHQQKITN